MKREKYLCTRKFISIICTAEEERKKWKEGRNEGRKKGKREEGKRKGEEMEGKEGKRKKEKGRKIRREARQ